MSENLQHYTYIHRCGDDLQRVFYIGKGSAGRVNSYFNRNKHWKNIVAKHGLVTEKVAQWRTHQEALEHEKFLILCFRELGFQLCNLTDGGDGVIGYKQSEEQRAKTSERMKSFVLSEDAKVKISKAKLGNKARLGKKNSEYQKKKTAQVWKGKTLSNEHKKKLSIAKIGKKLSEETRQKMSIAQKMRWSK